MRSPLTRQNVGDSYRTLVIVSRRPALDRPGFPGERDVFIFDQSADSRDIVDRRCDLVIQEFLSTDVVRVPGLRPQRPTPRPYLAAS